MLPLSRYLKKRGYKTLRILYPSREMNLEQLTEFLHDKIISSKKYSPDAKIHFVAHSMGGLLVRYYIDKYKPQNLGRVVMLSPPNSGSDFADALNDHEQFGDLYRKLFGPAAAQLTTTYQHPDGPINYELGIIAGSTNLNPLAPFFIPKKRVGPHDGIVPVERTKIEGMTDFITMKTSHTFMMFNPFVMRQVYAFLTTGHFYHKETPRAEKELVALLHGIANPGLIMLPMSLWLEDHGYDVLNIEYPSQDLTIPRLTKYVHKALVRHKYHEYKKLHFVTFSLGSLVLRAYLMRARPSNLGRVVMLGPPNQGSQAADALKDEWYYKLFFGPAGQQLTTETLGPYANNPVDYDVGIIAGTKNEFSPVDFLMKPMGKEMPKPNDGAVTVENTKLAGMKDHITVHTSHPMLIDDTDAKTYTVNFLQTGSFTRISDTDTEQLSNPGGDQHRQSPPEDNAQRGL